MRDYFKASHFTSGMLRSNGFLAGEVKKKPLGESFGDLSLSAALVLNNAKTLSDEGFRYPLEIIDHNSIEDLMETLESDNAIAGLTPEEIKQEMRGNLLFATHVLNGAIEMGLPNDLEAYVKLAARTIEASMGKFPYKTNLPFHSIVQDIGVKGFFKDLDYSAMREELHKAAVKHGHYASGERPTYPVSDAVFRKNRDEFTAAEAAITTMFGTDQTLFDPHYPTLSIPLLATFNTIEDAHEAAQKLDILLAEPTPENLEIQQDMANAIAKLNQREVTGSFRPSGIDVLESDGLYEIHLTAPKVLTRAIERDPDLKAKIEAILLPKLATAKDVVRSLEEGGLENEVVIE